MADRALLDALKWFSSDMAAATRHNGSPDMMNSACRILEDRLAAIPDPAPPAPAREPLVVWGIADAAGISHIRWSKKVAQDHADNINAHSIGGDVARVVRLVEAPE